MQCAGLTPLREELRGELLKLSVLLQQDILKPVLQEFRDQLGNDALQPALEQLRAQLRQDLRS
eukprot:8123763-Lingulodinium_polyedra.AAC.1